MIPVITEIWPLSGWAPDQSPEALQLTAPVACHVSVAEPPAAIESGSIEMLTEGTSSVLLDAQWSANKTSAAQKLTFQTLRRKHCRIAAHL